MKKNMKNLTALLILLLVAFSCTKTADKGEVIWYDRPAESWGESFPCSFGYNQKFAAAGDDLHWALFNQAFIIPNKIVE